MILIPGTSHQITWSVQNLADTTTYYVKAVIRDVRTETVLDTVLLTNLGNGRFSNFWRVPQDPTGFGREVEIEKTVYEDAAYTVVSSVYGRWLDRYLIFNIASRFPSTGGYGGHSVDYKQIAKMIKDELAAALAPLYAEESNEEGIDLTPLTLGVKNVLSGLSGLSARISGVEDAHGLIDDKIEALAAQIDGHRSVMEDSVSKIAAQITQEVKSMMAELASGMDESAENNKMETMLALEKKLDGEIQKILGRFGSAMDGHAKAIGSHIKKTMAEPLHVSLVAKTHPSNEPNPREDKIRNLIG